MARWSPRRLLRRPARAIVHPAGLVAAIGVELILWGGDTRTRLPGAPAQPVVLVAVELALAAVLLTQGRRLRGAFVLVWAATVLLGLVYPGFEPFVALMIVVYRVARTMPRRAALPYALTAVVPWGINVANAAASRRLSLVGLVIDAVLWIVVTALVWMAGRYGWGLEQLAREREAAAEQRARLAQQEERMRLARDLHDAVSHSVSAMMLQASGALAALTPEGPTREVLEAIEDTGANAMRELRRLLGLLVPTPTSASPQPVGVRDLGEIDDLVRRTRACGIEVEVRETGARIPLGTAAGEVAYHVVQEGLANVIRHGGAGGRATLRLDWGFAGLEIELVSTSDAPPATPVGGSSGRGLGGLRRRLAEVGGELESGPLDAGAFRLWAFVPRDSPAVTTGDPARAAAR